jgi:hypothetical protein
VTPRNGRILVYVLVGITAVILALVVVVFIRLINS